MTWLPFIRDDYLRCVGKIWKDRILVENCGIKYSAHSFLGI